MSDLAVAILLGALLGAGLWSIVAATPRFAAPRLLTRVAPYVRDVTDPAGRTPREHVAFDPASGLVAASRRIWLLARGRLVWMLGGGADLRRRFQRAGWRLSVEDFRGRQLAAALLGTATGIALAAFLVTRGASPAVYLALPLALALTGFLSGEVVLTRAMASRRSRIEDELPAVLDFLALCLAAGESLPEAVRRTGAIGSGALAAELRRVTHAADTGTAFATALLQAADTLGVPPVSRVVEQIVSALERGAPLAAVLRDQTADAQEEERRRLLESAGRKEVAMMLPLVLLILPLSVLMAAYPGFVLLQQGFR